MYCHLGTCSFISYIRVYSVCLLEGAILLITQVDLTQTLFEGNQGPLTCSVAHSPPASLPPSTRARARWGPGLARGPGLNAALSDAETAPEANGASFLRVLLLGQQYPGAHESRGVSKS